MITPETLQKIKTLPQLLACLRKELEWPIEGEEPEDLTFDYEPQELGIDANAAVAIKEIKQIRPIPGANQPWGIFWVNFDKKRLPVVVLRSILRGLVLKKRASAHQAVQKTWNAGDLLFISSYGEEGDRAVTFAHFSEVTGSRASELRVLGWDDDDTPLHMDAAARILGEKLRWDEEFRSNPDQWREQWASAFVLHPKEVIQTAQQMALELAGLAKRIRSRIRTILKMEDGFGEIRKLMRAFQQGLIHDLKDDDFADMFAQTVTYGLFSVAVQRTFPGIGSAVVKDDVPNLIFTSPFLKDMLGVFLGLKSREGKIDFDELGLSDVTDLLQSPDTHMEAVLQDFGNRTKNEDPVIHFYEHFLAAYDKKKKIKRGAFYTPRPVVSYIVRSVHELLQTEFGLEDGLADTTTWGEMLKRNPKMKLPPLTDEPGEKSTITPDEPFVRILDPATGTGTFLVEVIEVIHKTLTVKWEKQGKSKAEIHKLWNEYVPKSLLPRLYGYELMMAPYAIAHMKLGLKLSETGYRFSAEDRAHIYLTNSLEPAGDDKQGVLEGIFPALAHEAAAVNRVKKNKRFSVVIGNPPYSGVSSNTGDWITQLIRAYYFVNGLPLGERNPKWLQDDYVKFIRFGQWVLSCSGVGLFSYITNHSYIDNPTFRGFRRAFATQFSHIAVLDLHGNSKKKELSPDGTTDENVFDGIQQGVAIFAAWQSHDERRMLLHGDLFGSRRAKHIELLGSSYASTKWVEVASSEPHYLLVPQSEDLRAEYEAAPRITDITMTNGWGVATRKDYLLVDYDGEKLRSRFNKILGGTAREAYALGLRDNPHWKFSSVKARLGKAVGKRVVKYAYRPLDIRWVFYEPLMIERGDHRWPIARHLFTLADNLSMLVSRTGAAAGSPVWDVLFVANGISDLNLFRRGGAFMFPLYLVPGKDELAFSSNRAVNFSARFLDALCSQLGSHPRTSGVPADLTPEDIFHYIYAVFHSPTYRTRYAEFLKIDFPRLPLTSSLDLFRALAGLGGELVALHLMESPKLDKHITKWHGGKNPQVEKVTYSDKTVWIDGGGTSKAPKPGTSGFRGVPESVWNFHIGGYQVCEKWLKDRKGRTLSADDITHYHRIVVALSETIRLMAEIDKVIVKHGGWPGAFQPLKG